MLHSNSNTHAHQQLNKGSDRHGENAIRAQGVSYNPAGSNKNATNTGSTFNTTGNTTSNYDSLSNQASTLNTNTVNPSTQANAETIGGRTLGLETHNNLNTSSKLDSHNNSNLAMGNLQPSFINDLPGAYPTNSSNTLLDSKPSTQTGHESTLNKKPITTTTNQSNPQTGIHLNQHENTTHDKLSNNTTGLHSTTTDKSSKLSSGVDQPHFDNDHSTSSHSRLSRIPHETTAAALASHGIALPDQKLHNNTYDHTNPTASTGHNNSSVNSEIYGVGLGKAPSHEQTISKDHKHKDILSHKSDNSGMIGKNRQYDNEVARGLISDETKAHLEHTPEKFRENHKPDLGESFSDKKIYANPNSTSLYNEYTPAVPGKEVNSTNPDVITMKPGKHHKHIGNTNTSSENSHHGSTTHNTGSSISTDADLGAAGLAISHHGKDSSPLKESGLNKNSSSLTSGDAKPDALHENKHGSETRKSGSSIVAGATVAALGAVGLANIYRKKHPSSSHDSNLDEKSSSVASGDVGAANLYESQHEPPIHSTGPNTATKVAGLDNSIHNNHMSSTHNSSLNNTSSMASGDVGAANLYQSQHEPLTHTTGLNTATGTALGASNLDNSYHNNHMASGDVGAANLYQSQHESSTHTTGPNTATDSSLGAAGLAISHPEKQTYSTNSSGLNNHTSNISSGALGSANLYESQLKSSTHGTGVPLSNTNAHQKPLTGNILHSSNVLGATDTHAPSVKNKNEYSGTSTGDIFNELSK